MITAAELLKDSEFFILDEEFELLGKRTLLAKFAYLQFYGVALDQVRFDCEIVAVNGLKIALLTFFACE